MATFSLLAPLHALPGHAFGLQQSCLFGNLQVALPIDESALDELDAALSAHMRDPVPARPPTANDESAVSAWVHRLLQWTLVIQRDHRVPVSMRFVCRAMGTPSDSAQTFFVALPSVDQRASRASLDTVLALANRAPGAPVVSAQLDELANQLEPFSAPGVNTHSILAAAHDLDLPVWEYVPTIWGVGTGARARLFSSTITDRTPAIGVKVARDKRGTALLLRRAGLPAPEHLQATSLEQALEHAQRLGYPVVIKPADLDQGKGITADIQTPDELRTAWQTASTLSKLILVERHIEGFTHRLTVMQGRVIKVVKRLAGGVTGNGIDDIRALVEQASADPLRSRVASRTGRAPLALDDEARGLLARAGLTETHVPRAGAYIRLRRRDNVNAGGTNELVPVDEVHLDNLIAATGAARHLRLDLAGVDLIVPDIRKSWRETGGAICEVNGQPQMGTRDTPEIYRELILALQPAPGRVPVHLVILASDAPAGLDALAPTAQATGADTLAMTEGIFRAGRKIAGPFHNGLRAGLAALADPGTEALAFAMDARSLATLGLPCSRVDTVRLAGKPANEAERKLLRTAIERIRHNIAAANEEEPPR